MIDKERINYIHLFNKNTGKYPNIRDQTICRIYSYSYKFPIGDSMVIEKKGYQFLPIHTKEKSKKCEKCWNNKMLE